MRYIIPFIIALMLHSCQRALKTSAIDKRDIDIQGHRGCRGLMPENTLPAFQKALELDVNTLELDLAVTKDNQLIVSHEPYFRAGISKDPDGHPISPEDEKSHNIFQMTFDQCKRYDVGTTKDPKHPEREDVKTFKPLLSQVVDKAKHYAYSQEKPAVQYNIEIKRSPEYDGIYHPDVETYVNLVLAEINDLYIQPETTIQSFDLETLRLVKAKNPDIKIALLIQNEQTPKKNIQTLGFKPNVYSCYYELLDEESISYLKSEQIEVIPWTVNANEDIQKMLDLGVDGIISDYPDRVIALAR